MSSAQFDEPHNEDDKANPISILMVELCACLQMILMDVAQASDLTAAGRRWVQRLRSLAALIESTLHVDESADGQVQAGAVRPSRARHAGFLDIAPHSTSTPDPTSSAPFAPSAPSSVLTLREFEILTLSKKGLSPRKIAARLQLSVQTVYTHLRNIRSKQRKLL